MTDERTSKNPSNQNKHDIFSGFVTNMNHLFGSKPHKGGVLQSIDDFFLQSSQNRSFPIEMEEKESMYIVKAKLPGIEKQQIHIEAFNQSLVIAVQNHENITQKNTNSQNYELQMKQAMKRRITFVKPINDKEITAGHNNGLLEITVPKLKGKPIKIMKQ